MEQECTPWGNPKARVPYSVSCTDLKSASSAAWSFFTRSSRRRISWRSFCASAEVGTAARCGGADDAVGGALRWVAALGRGANVCAGSAGHADVVAGAEGAKFGGAKFADAAYGAAPWDSAPFCWTEGGENRPLRTRLAACDELVSSSRSEPRAAAPAAAGLRRLFTRAIRSCGWKGLRTSSSALTCMALSATVRFTTPDIRITGVFPKRSCSFMNWQTS